MNRSMIGIRKGIIRIGIGLIGVWIGKNEIRIFGIGIR